MPGFACLLASRRCPCLYPRAEPASHRILDFWLLLAMLTLGADRRKAAEAILGWALSAEITSCLPAGQLDARARV